VANKLIVLCLLWAILKNYEYVRKDVFLVSGVINDGNLNNIMIYPINFCSCLIIFLLVNVINQDNLHNIILSLIDILHNLTIIQYFFIHFIIFLLVYVINDDGLLLNYKDLIVKLSSLIDILRNLSIILLGAYINNHKLIRNVLQTPTHTNKQRQLVILW